MRRGQRAFRSDNKEVRFLFISENLVDSFPIAYACIFPKFFEDLSSTTFWLLIEWNRRTGRKTVSSIAPSTLATMLKQQATMSKQHSTLLPNGNNVERVHRKILSFRQSRNKSNIFNLFRLCRKDETSFGIVAENDNNVEATFDFVDATFDSVQWIVRLVAFDNVASTL